jgi:signal transduction histidine kinase
MHLPVIADVPTPLDYWRLLLIAQFKAGFLARASHELRSPLSSLMGLQQLILNDLCDDAAEERSCVAQSYEAAQRLLGMMEVLVKVSKLDQGRSATAIGPVNLLDCLDEVTMVIQMPLQDRNVRLRMGEVAPELTVLAHVGALQQVFVSLLDAVIARSEGEALGVEVEVFADSVRLMLVNAGLVAAWTEALDGLVPTEPTKVLPVDQLRLSPEMQLVIADQILGCLGSGLVREGADRLGFVLPRGVDGAA